MSHIQALPIALLLTSLLLSGCSKYPDEPPILATTDVPAVAYAV